MANQLSLFPEPTPAAQLPLFDDLPPQMTAARPRLVRYRSGGYAACLSTTRTGRATDTETREND